MHILKLFKFEKIELRVIDQHGNPWFVLTEVLTAMHSATKVTDAVESIIQGLGDGFVTNVPIVDRLGRKQSTTIIAESATTYLISRSNTDTGRKLNRFIHVEVLPEIRKTGSCTKPLSLAEQALQSAQVLVALEQEQLRLAQHQVMLEAKTAALEASTATLEATLAETTATLDSQIADLQIQHRNGVPLHHLSKSQAHHAYSKGLSEKVFHSMLAYAKIPTQEYTHLTEEGQSVVTFAYLPDSIPEALKSLVQNSTQVSACYCESKELNLRFRCQQKEWLAH